MAAPPGNQFWKLRSKHGRNILFATPELLWDAACEYFEATDARKWIKKDWVGKDAMPVDRPNETPYTLSGLFLYLDCNPQYFRDFKETLAKKTVERHEDFALIIARIEQIIWTQKFEGAAVGAFNANIIARELGLKEQSEVDNTHKISGPEITVSKDGNEISLKVKE